jgi:type I restriction enzyme M protein
VSTGAKMSEQALSSLIWSVADLLRGDFKQSEFGKVILPFTVLRRLDCVLADTKAEVLLEYAEKTKAGLVPDPFLLRKSGQTFYNVSPMDMAKVLGDEHHIRENLFSYVQGFSPAVRDIFDGYDFTTQIERLEKSGLLYQVTEKFAGIDLHPNKVTDIQMASAILELISKIAETSSENFPARSEFKCEPD